MFQLSQPPWPRVGAGFIVMLAPDKLNPSGRRNWRSLLPLFEIARVLVRFDHVARFIVNANHHMM